MALCPWILIVLTDALALNLYQFSAAIVSIPHSWKTELATSPDDPSALVIVGLSWARLLILPGRFEPPEFERYKRLLASPPIAQTNKYMYIYGCTPHHKTYHANTMPSVDR